MLSRLQSSRSERWWRPVSGMLAVAAIWACAVLPAMSAETVSSAVVLMYHRFGEDNAPSTNIRIKQFEEHIVELRSGNYNVVPLAEIVAALAEHRQLPPRTVAITIDDAHRSIYEEAWPRLRGAGLPFTVFVSTNPVDRRLPGYLSWEQLRQLAASDTTIANHTMSHLHMTAANDATNAAEIEGAHRRIIEEIGNAPPLFAYPYGEYSNRTIELVKAAGLTAALGQQSGVAHELGDPFQMPRFALNETYGDIGRFRLVVNSLPLPVHEVTPNDTLLDGNNPPPFGFTVDQRIAEIDRLDCFASNGRTMIERLGERRFEVRIPKPFASRRGRFNCTVPTRDGRFRWFGIQFVIP